MEEVNVKNNSKIIIFLVIALCICISLITYLILNPQNKECDKCPQNNTIETEKCKEDSEEVKKEEVEEIGGYPNLYTTNLNKKNIITLFDRFIHVSGFVYEPYLEEMKYDKVIYIGYSGNEKYYKVLGTYTCYDAELNCYYSPQDEETKSKTRNLASGIIVFEKDVNSERYTLKAIDSGGLEDYTLVNQELN